MLRIDPLPAEGGEARAVPACLPSPFGTKGDRGGCAFAFSAPPTKRSISMIEVKNLHKAFGEVKAVDGVTITGLLGPNGAGKTTTLRMLYTLMKPDSGQVLVDGIDAAVDPIAVRRCLGVLPDARGLYKRLTARENIDYFARLHGIETALMHQ